MTPKGKEQVKKSAEAFKNKKIDIIVSSPFIRTKETAEIFADIVGFNKEKIIFDFGKEQRQIMAGIAEYIEDVDTLVGKEMPVVVNLEPRKLRGYESQGMILVANDEGRIALLHPAQEVTPGSSVG